MKFTNAFLASLLFFGVTPLALDKKRDEHALTTTSSPFTTTSTRALVPPDDAGVVEITGGTHDVLEARARGSRGGSRTKTTRPARTKKTKTKPKKKAKAKSKKTKTKTKSKGKPKSTCTAKQKKAGKCKDTCTAKQKKAGKCPDQKKKRNWEVLRPTKGCRPKNCKKCGKATGAKGSKKSGKKTIRDLSSLRSLTLSKRAATFEPASRDKAGLMAWTKDVWASSPKVLHMPENSTSVVAISDEGVYVSHHWQNTVGDASYKDLTPQFDNAFTNPLTGKRRASFRLTPAQKRIATEYLSEAEVKSDVDDVYPTTGFEALTDVKSSLTADSNVQSMVAVWDGVEGTGDKYRTTGAHMKSFVDGLLPGTATKLVKYENTENAMATSRDDSDYHGKVIVSYDSATKKYQVWMPAADLTGPILKN
ncbi:uncharacterized protein N0V89_012080 [Didymosphaeria variabile]|uniref:Uncharacterized protein n=1 Tax=Didymosphaeria variabile TaxID=1932322 RepID=A0A9W8XB68_9PLEO|nr:uncharacterized protein N0V89_012080 [Didymosphaeria variabile]KAJ4345944.1 hypothetical protein N0V89_012080 [Didymosphaeria variabile]